MKINNISNQSFGATLKGDYKDVIKLSAGNGLKNKEIKSALSMIHKACPKKEDKVYLYYKDVYRSSGCPWSDEKEFLGVRSGVKVYKDGKLYELNVDPKSISPKYLLPLMAVKVDKLVSGKIKSDDMVKIYS